jgi:hypothetical protein
MDKKRIILKGISFAVFAIIVVIIVFIIVRYSENGENKLPFTIKNLTVASSAEGIQKEGATEIWNLEIVQINDFYITIDKINDMGDGYDKIDDVQIKNIKIDNPNVGDIVTYIPSAQEGEDYSFDEKYKVGDSIIFESGATTNLKKLEIASNGGQIQFRLANRGIGSYVSTNPAEEIIHDGTILKKTEHSLEDLKFHVKFDLIISVEKVNYKTTIELDLPCGNIDTEGRAIYEKENDGTNFIFKRERQNLLNNN